jgi:hypothetical protein
MSTVAHLKRRNSRNISAKGLCQILLAGTSMWYLVFSSYMLHVRTPLRYVFAELMRAADLANLYVPLYFRPVCRTTNSSGTPSHACGIPLCLFSAPQPV